MLSSSHFIVNPDKCVHFFSLKRLQKKLENGGSGFEIDLGAPLRKLSAKSSDKHDLIRSHYLLLDYLNNQRRLSEFYSAVQTWKRVGVSFIRDGADDLCP